MWAISCRWSPTPSALPPLLEAASLGPRQAGGRGARLSRYAGTNAMASDRARLGRAKLPPTPRRNASGATSNARQWNRSLLPPSKASRTRYSGCQARRPNSREIGAAPARCLSAPATVSLPIRTGRNCHAPLGRPRSASVAASTSPTPSKQRVTMSRVSAPHVSLAAGTRSDGVKHGADTFASALRIPALRRSCLTPRPLMPRPPCVAHVLGTGCRRRECRAALRRGTRRCASRVPVSTLLRSPPTREPGDQGICIRSVTCAPLRSRLVQGRGAPLIVGRVPVWRRNPPIPKGSDPT